MDKLEASWQGLTGERLKAISLVKRLGDMSKKYQALEGKIRRASDSAARDREKIDSLERDLESYAQKWQNQWHAYPDNPSASQDIEDLLNSLDRQWDLIRQQHKRGEKDYDQVYKALEQLHRKVRYYQAALDEDHAVDANGRVITRR
jgi:chromosome segregation ATPase